MSLKLIYGSICISAVGEIIFTVVTISVDLLGVIPLSDLFRLIGISYGIKLIVDALAVGPSTLLANILKKIEGVDIYESDIKFNLFVKNTPSSQELLLKKLSS